MRPIQTAKVEYDVFRLAGGLDLVSPTLSLPPGVAREALNFEVSLTGGYSRIYGYERFDGHPSPAASTYGAMTLNAPTGTLPVAGNTIQDAASSPTRTATVVGVDAATSTIYYTKVVGSAWTDGVSVYLGSTLLGTYLGSLIGPAVSAENQALYSARAADAWRADIAAVPGSGPVRGVVYFGGVVYAWRNNVGGTAMDIYKSSSSGWTQVSLGFELGFTGGTGTAIAEGNTVTGATSGATGVVSRVVITNGTTWAGAVGRLILSSKTGTFTASENLQVGGVTRAVDSGGAATAITLAAGGRVQTAIGSISGAVGARIYGCDNVNYGFEFDGTVYAPIRTGMTNDKPTNVAVHKNYLVYSFGPSVQNSGLGTPYVWSPVFGGNEIALPEDVTALQSMPGDANSATLAVYTRNNTYLLYGVNTTTWNLVAYDRGTGAAPYTAQTIVDAYTLDDKGVTALSTSRNFGGFDSATLTFQIRPFIQARRLLATASSINRERSQYRVFYSDGYGLYLTIVNGKLLGAMPVQYPTSVFCTCEGETIAGGEISYFGGANGYVYRMDTGPDFDGSGISFLLTLVYNSQKSPRVLKRYRRASLEVQGIGYSLFSVGFSLAYGSTALLSPTTTDYLSSVSGTGNWDFGFWDLGFWDGKLLAPQELTLNGTAENIATSILGNSRLTQPFTISSVALHYSIRRGLR
jgi:hypothetical protein